MRVAFRILATLWAALMIGQAWAQQNYLPTIKWRTVAEGAQSRFARAENRFLYTSGDLQKWYAESTGDAAQNVPYKIDFNKEFAVVIALGERKSGGFRVYVETIARTTAASAAIAVVELTPAKGSSSAQSLTHPWVLIAIERCGVQDWQFRTAQRSDLPAGASVGCGCCAACTCMALYNPAPLGVLSVDNNYGVRQLGATPFKILDAGDDCDIARQSSFVIQTQRQLIDYWSHFREGEKAPEAPIDWRVEQLLAIHMGAQPTTGYELKIVGIERTWYGQMNVLYAVRSPGPTDRVRRRETSPYCIIRMSRVTEPINFVRRDDLWPKPCACKCASCKGQR